MDLIPSVRWLVANARISNADCVPILISPSCRSNGLIMLLMLLSTPKNDGLPLINSEKSNSNNNKVDEAENDNIA